MRTRVAGAEIIGEFASKVLATTLTVYPEFVECEAVSDGRMKRTGLWLGDVRRVRIEAVPSARLVDLVLEDGAKQALRLPMMDRASAHRAKALLERLVAERGRVRRAPGRYSAGSSPNSS